MYVFIEKMSIFTGKRRKSKKEPLTEEELLYLVENSSEIDNLSDENESLEDDGWESILDNDGKLIVKR